MGVAASTRLHAAPDHSVEVDSIARWIPKGLAIVQQAMKHASTGCLFECFLTLTLARVLQGSLQGAVI